MTIVIEYCVALWQVIKMNTVSFLVFSIKIFVMYEVSSTDQEQNDLFSDLAISMEIYLPNLILSSSYCIHYSYSLLSPLALTLELNLLIHSKTVLSRPGALLNWYMCKILHH